MLVECKKCGAPLDVKENDWIVRCGYCGSTTRVARTRTLAAVTPEDWSPPKSWKPPAQTGLPTQALKKRTLRAGAGAFFGTFFTLATVAVGVLVPLFAEGVLTWPFSDAEPPKAVTRGLDEPPKGAALAELEEKHEPEPATPMQRETRAHRAGTRALARGSAALSAGDLDAAIEALDEAQRALGRREQGVHRLRGQVASRGAREVGLKVVNRCADAQALYRSLRRVGAERAAGEQFVDGCPRP